MRLSTNKRKTAIAIWMAAAAALGAASATGWAASGPAISATTVDVLVPRHEARAAGTVRPAPALMSLTEESRMPPRGIRLRAIVARAWDDSVATWKRILQGRASEIDGISLQYVSKLKPNNCYGLYAGEGPVYCSGNRTVFVGTDAAKRLLSRFGQNDEAGITFLIGHEFGHHIQNMNGRFLLLGRILARTPRPQRPEIVRRFELEADCYAGIWMRSSEVWARSAAFRADVLSVLGGIGDDTIAGEPLPAEVIAAGAHGTSQQRRRWFLRGTKVDDIRACNTFRTPYP
jgi:uncharacterized protein